MTPEQALQILREAWVTRPGLTLADIQAILQAFQVLAQLVEKQKTNPAE